MTLRTALLESNNRAAAALQQQIGARPVIQFAADVGLHDQPDVPSLALGTGLVTPLELTTAYAAFPNGGLAVRPRALARVLDGSGGEVFATTAQSTRVLPETVAFQMVTMLQDVIDRGTGAGARNLGVQFPAGGKTGTTDDFRDAWFVGFSSSLIAGVWVGHDQPRSIGAEATARASRCRSERFHAPRGGALSGETVQRPARDHTNATLPHLLATASRGLPHLHRVLQGRR